MRGSWGIVTREGRWRVGVSLTVVVLIAAALVAPHSPVGSRLLPFVAFLLLIVPVHELGHALAGTLVGHRITMIQIGVGPRLFGFEAFGANVQVGAVPVGGMTFGFPAHNRRAIRGRQWVFAAGGVLANVALFLIMRRLFGSAIFDEEKHPFLAMANSANWSVLIVNPIPFRVAEGTASDGYQLLTIPFWPRERVQLIHIVAETQQIMRRAERGDVVAALDHARALRQRHPGHAASANTVGLILHLARRHEEARVAWREALAQATDPSGAALIKNNIAYAGAVLGRAEDLGEADRLSAEAVIALTDAAPVWGTRGAVLVRLGRAAEALPLLERGLAAPQRREDRATTLAFKAAALVLVGRREEARATLDVARALDETCELLPWGQSILDAPSAATAPVAASTAEAATDEPPSARGDAGAALTRAAAGAALLGAWRRDARIAAFAAILILPEQLGVPFLFGFIVTVFVELFPERSGVLALALGCAWAGLVQASGQVHFTGLTDPSVGAALVGLGFAGVFLWLFRRADRFQPVAPSRAPLVLGLLLGVPLALTMSANVLAWIRDSGALNRHEAIEAVTELGFGLMALGAVWALARNPRLRPLAAIPFGVALVATVGSSDWRFERQVVHEIPPNGSAIAWGEPRDLPEGRKREIAVAAARATLSPGGVAFALFQRAPTDDDEDADERDGERTDPEQAGEGSARRRPPGVVHVGDFGTRLVEIPGLAGSFIDDERLLIVRRGEDGKSCQLVEVQPFAGGAVLSSRQLPGLIPETAKVAIDRGARQVYVHGYDAEAKAQVVLMGPLDGGSGLVELPSPSDLGEEGRGEYPIVEHAGPAGVRRLVHQLPPRPVGPAAARSGRFTPRPRGALWLVDPEGKVKMPSVIDDVSCASPPPGAPAIWCTPSGMMRPMLLRIDAGRRTIERIPGRFMWARSMSMVGPSTLASLTYAELRVANLATRRGVRFLRPASDASESNLTLAEGGLALFRSSARNGKAAIRVYPLPRLE